jgi:hypothetical protein
MATVVDITGTGGFHQHWGAQDTARYWTGPHQWDQWWIDWFGGGTPPALFNARARAGVYLNHLWLPVGPFATAGTYHLYVSQTQVRPIVELVGWYAIGRPYHYTPADINWEMEFDFTVK